MTPRVLVVHPHLASTSGGNAVAAHALAELSTTYDVGLLSFMPADFPYIDHHFGTELAALSIRQFTPPWPWTLAATRLPLSLWRLRAGVLAREARRIQSEWPHEVVISTCDELDFGRPGLQYIHFPAFEVPGRTPARDCDAVQAWPVRIYRRLTSWIAPMQRDGILSNTSLVNSNYVGALVRDLYGVEPITLYPPVPADYPDVPWDQRQAGFICVGRLSPEKNIERVVEIVRRVRGRGHSVTLDVAGPDGKTSVIADIRELARRNPEWLKLHLHLSRRELARLIANRRYGLHGMPGEHFGIAVAELQRAGLVTFVPDQGGVTEIVEGDPRFIYANVDDAVEKIHATLTNPAHEAAMRGAVARRRDLFSVERFRRHLAQEVAAFLSRG